MRVPRFAFPAVVLLASLFAVAPLVHADDSSMPQPSPYPISWQLDFTHAVPRRIVVQVPGKDTPQAYWYMTFTVTNNTSQEQTFLPQFDLLDHNGNITQSNMNIPPEVFQAIKAREQNKQLEPFTQIVGKLLIGPAEAKDGVAIWPETTPRMGHFSIFISGLSGETITLQYKDGRYQPVTDAELLQHAKNLVVLRKTLQLKFFVNGDEVYPGEDQVNKGAKRWIMR